MRPRGLPGATPMFPPCTLVAAPSVHLAVVVSMMTDLQRCATTWCASPVRGISMAKAPASGRADCGKHPLLPCCRSAGTARCAGPPQAGLAGARPPGTSRRRRLDGVHLPSLSALLCHQYCRCGKMLQRLSGAAGDLRARAFTRVLSPWGGVGLRRHRRINLSSDSEKLMSSESERCTVGAACTRQ